MINRDAVLELLTEAVTVYGENHNAVCEYSTRDAAKYPLSFTGEVKPICIAGVVVYKLGGEEALKALTPGPINMPENKLVLDGLGFDSAAQRALKLAQYSQDSGCSWGSAVEFAKEFNDIDADEFYGQVIERAEQDIAARDEAEGYAE